MSGELLGKRKRKGIDVQKNSTEEADAGAEVFMSFEELLARSPGRLSLLCPVCEKIFEGDVVVSDSLSENNLVPHHHNANSLKDSVKAGCYICTTTATRFASDSPELFEQDPPCKTSYSLQISSKEHVCLFIHLNAGSDNLRSAMFFSLCPIWGRFNDLHGSPTLVATKYRLTQNTSSAACWDLVLQWLRNCTENHHENCVNPNPEYLPKRVIDVGGAEEAELYLCTDVSRGGNKARYMTLSHCWGSAKIPTLISTNIHEMQCGFKLSSLPRTFREAILITRRLGIRYLWVDSLCILQDSELDWQEEAATMKDVYGNSYCNIAAAGARNSNEGLFIEREELSLQLCHVRLTWNSENLPPNPQRIKQKMHYTLQEAHTEVDLDEEPLNKRAWFFQERLLAPRVLYFASEQIFWECERLLACETRPEGRESTKKRNFREIQHVYDKQKPSSEVVLLKEDSSKGNPPITNRLLIKDKRLSSQKTAGKAHSLGESWCSQWLKLVNDYSKCDMTRGSDKLVALSGIAKIFKDTYEQEYLAGLWREDLVYELLWRLENSFQMITRPVSRRPETYRAPSWSWASTDGEIYWRCNRNQGISLVEIVDVYTLPVTTDETGQVAGGRLTIVGDLVKCKVRLEYGGCQIYLSLEESKFQEWVKELGVPLVWKPHFEADTLCFEDVKEDFSQTFSEYYLLPVYRSTDDHRAIEGLILKRTSDAGYYVRRGVFHSQKRAYGVDLVYEASKRPDLFSSPDCYADSEKRILHIL